MLIERETNRLAKEDDVQDKNRNFVWCNIGTALKQNFVAHQFRFYEGSAYNTTPAIMYQIDAPVSEAL